MVSRYTVYVLLTIALLCVAALSQVILSYAADIHATITTGLFVPSKPLNLAVSIEDQSVDLSWSSPASSGGLTVTDYVIEYKLTSGGVWSIFTDGVSTDTTGTITSLTNDTSYDFRVSAVNAIGQGTPSTQVTAIPGSPAQVLVTGFSDMTVPDIAASVRITNEGLVAYEYQYTWCITNSDINLCGEGDDLFSSTAAKLIQPGENWDTILNSTIANRGNYWFHVEVEFGSDVSYASQSFTAAEQSGGGGGGSGSKSKSRSCVGGDFNQDKIVNLVDFSILLIFFNKPAPFANPCVDINKDNLANVTDFSILLVQWGKKPVLYKQTTL